MTSTGSVHYILLGGDAAATGAFAASVGTSGGAARVSVASSPVIASANSLARDSEFVCFVKADGVVGQGASERILAFFAENPDVDMLYTDEGVMARRRSTELHKPIYSPERLRNQDYLGDLVVYRGAHLDAVGYLDESLPGAELYDLELRATRAARSVGHLDIVGLHRTGSPVRTADDETTVASVRTALERHLAATGGGTVRAVGVDGVHDTRRPVVGEPLVSIVIPSRGIWTKIDGQQTCFVIDCVRSIVEKSTYTNVEIVIVADSVAEPEVLDELARLAGDRLVVAHWTKEFNFSDKINYGALHSSGDYLLILNDDTKVLAPDWIEALLALAQLPGAGMSGALLYFGDGSIQHAGHGYYEDDVSHIGLDADHDDPGPLNGYRVEREVSGVTAACALMPTSVFHEVGGLTNLLPGNFNDVDLCLKVAYLGYDIYWTPHATLNHYESKTRDPAVHGFEVDVIWTRWAGRLHDPRYWPYPHNRPPV